MRIVALFIRFHEHDSIKTCLLFSLFLKDPDPFSRLFESLWLFPVFFTDKQSLQTSIPAQKYSWQAVSLFSVYRMCPQSILIYIQSLDFKTKTDFLSRENTTTSWNERNMDKSYSTPCRTPVTQLNEPALYITLHAGSLFAACEAW